MLYRVGFGSKVKKIIWAGHFVCPHCGSVTDHHLYKIKSEGSIFFVPIFSVTAKRMVVCDSCQNGKQLSKKEYNELYARAKERLKNREFPKNIILSDFNPNELHYGRKIFYLILAAFFCFIMVCGTIGMVSDIGTPDGSVYIGGLLMLALGIVPFIAAIRSFLSAKRKKQIYRNIN